jgi:GTP-binding protein
MRKKARVTEKLEKLSVADGLRAVRFAEVVVVLLDVEIPFEVQDLRIADFAETEGRAVVVAVNKWDLEDDKQDKLAELKEMFERLLPQLRGAPLVTVSAKTGRGLDRLHDAIRKAHDVWNRRIPTARLNTWLGAMTEAHPPPAPGGHRIKLRYMTQAKTRPPGFMVKCSRPDELPDSYKRYLVNGLRDHFDMPGTPIRLFSAGRQGEVPEPVEGTQVPHARAGHHPAQAQWKIDHSQKRVCAGRCLAGRMAAQASRTAWGRRGFTFWTNRKVRCRRVGSWSS